MAKLLIKNIELLHTPNGEMQNIAVEETAVVVAFREFEQAWKGLSRVGVEVCRVKQTDA